MTSPTSITGWNATAGSKTTNPFQENIIIDVVADNRTLNRQTYYRTNYDFMTGLRIAATLGGFFILVLLTLLYKSKCKRHSRCPSELSMDVGAAGRSSLLGNPLTVPDGNHEYYDGMIVGKENYFCHYATGDNGPRNHLKAIPFTKPQLRLTPAHSESSEDGLCGGRYDFSSSREDCLDDQEYFAGLDSTGNYFRRSSSCIQNGKTLLSAARTVSGPLGGSSEEAEEGKGRMKWLKQSIDINVILPTPTISPSSSETFTRLPRKNNNELLFYGRRDDAVMMREADNSFDDGSVNESESEVSAPVPLSSSSALCYLDNLKYMDDTSSENIPTRGSDYDDQDNDSRRSIRSDSIFTCYDPEYGPEVPLRPPPPPPPPVSQQTPPLPPKPSKSKFRRIFGSTPPYHLGLRRQSGGGGGGGPSNYCSGGATSVLLGNDDEEDCECRMTLTQAQVHHRDSYCGSELEYPHDYLESHRRRRSSSTQTTLSDLRQCLRSYGYISSSCSNASSQSQSNHSPAAANLHPGPYFTFSNVLSPRNSARLSPPPSGSPKVTHLANSVSPSPASPLLLSVSNFGQGRKRPSCKSLRKTTSLQCDE